MAKITISEEVAHLFLETAAVAARRCWHNGESRRAKYIEEKARNLRARLKRLDERLHRKDMR